MVLQYTYLTRASLCAWVAEDHNFAIQSPGSTSMRHHREKGLQPCRSGCGKWACISPWEAWNLYSKLSPASLFQTTLWGKKKGWSRFSSSSRRWMFSIWGHKISLSWPRENLSGADTVPKRSAEALINPSMGRPEARRKILISSTDTWVLSS